MKCFSPCYNLTSALLQTGFPSFFVVVCFVLLICDRSEPPYLILATSTSIVCVYSHNLIRTRYRGSFIRPHLTWKLLLLYTTCLSCSFWDKIYTLQITSYQCAEPNVGYKIDFGYNQEKPLRLYHNMHLPGSSDCITGKGSIFLISSDCCRLF